MGEVLNEIDTIREKYQVDLMEVFKRELAKVFAAHPNFKCFYAGHCSFQFQYKPFGKGGRAVWDDVEHDAEKLPPDIKALYDLAYCIGERFNTEIDGFIDRSELI